MSKVLTSNDLISDEELERSEWYWDWLRKADVFYTVGAVLPAGEDEIVSLGIHRPKRCGNFEEKDKLPVGQFLPHLERALQLRRRLLRSGVEGNAAIDALARTGVATVRAHIRSIFAKTARADRLSLWPACTSSVAVLQRR